MDVDARNIHSLVAMVGECKWRGQDMPINLFFSAKKAAIHIMSFSDEVFTEDDVDRFVTEIEKARMAPGSKTDRNHIRNLKSKHSE
ncbi:hypothetical protein D3C78_1378260 [compost metagenome]